MIVSLPAMIAQSNLDPESVALVKDYVNELFRYAAFPFSLVMNQINDVA